MDKSELIQQLTLEEKMLLLTQGEKSGIYDQTCPVPRLGIGVKYMYDGPHGVRNKTQDTASFPNMCCATSTWNRDTLYKMGQALADECINQNVDMLLAPGVNIKRHILCGRNYEYLSEDPLLSGLLGAEYIKGLQDKGVAACVKHYALNNQEKHREYISVEVDERAMREIYLKSFELAVKGSSPAAVMCSYNKVDAIWCSENRFLLQEILKDEWGYKGIVMSDWGAVHDISISLAAGLDMQMPRNRQIVEQLKDGLEKGKVTEERINDALSRALDFIMSPPLQKTEYDRKKQHAIAREIAADGIVLLKNEKKVLPLTAEKYSKITFVGEYAVSPLTCGQGAAEVYPDPGYIDSPLDETRKILGDKVDIQYYEGYQKGGYSNNMLWPTLGAFGEAIKESEAVVFFVGSMVSEDTEKYDRRTAWLNPNFELFIDKAQKMGKKVIAVIQSGSAVVIEDWKDKAHAIVQMWLGGESAGGGIADILTGKINPCGKLSETFPKCERTDMEYPGDGLKIVYKEGLEVGYRYYDKHPEEICFPFGHGLSYTSFGYSGLEVKPDGGKLNISVDITNVGDTDGSEVVQIYVGKDVSCVTRPEKELKAFEKLFLKAGETKRVEMKIEISDLAYYNRSMHAWVTEPGGYKIYVASSSRDVRLTEEVDVDITPPYSMQQLGASTMA